MEKVNKDGVVGEWSGWGIEEAEGTWAAALGWRSVEVSLCGVMLDVGDLLTEL